MLMGILCAILLFGCVSEACLLIWDKGRVSQLITAARKLAATQGWKAVLAPAVSFVIGQFRDLTKKTDRCGSFSDDMIHIAFSPSGGLGDYIISAKILEELQEICTCRIDVFCEKERFGKAVYGNRNGVSLKAYQDFEKSRNSYDLALLVEHFIHIKNYNRNRLRTLSMPLYRKVLHILEHWDRLYIDIPEQCFRERIQFERCRILGLNRWTELRMGGAFEIADKRVRIPLDESFLPGWERDGYPQKEYITFNYGTDVMRAGLRQLKMWPKESYEELAELIHRSLPGMKIVQLGDGDAEKIEGCDRYVFGESMEQTKWILKGSLFHIDCEGGLVHLATQLGTRCIVLFGPTPLHMYGYEENSNLQSVRCNNCMGLHEDWAYDCYQGWKAPECMRSITPDKVMEKIMAGYQEEDGR